METIRLKNEFIKFPEDTRDVAQAIKKWKISLAFQMQLGQ